MGEEGPGILADHIDPVLHPEGTGGSPEHLESPGVGIHGDGAQVPVPGKGSQGEGPHPAEEVQEGLPCPRGARDPGMLPGETRGEIGPFQIHMERDPVLAVNGGEASLSGKGVQGPDAGVPVDPRVLCHDARAGDEGEERLTDLPAEGFQLGGEPDQDHVTHHIEGPGEGGAERVWNRHKVLVPIRGRLWAHGECPAYHLGFRGEGGCGHVQHGEDDPLPFPDGKKIAAKLVAAR